MLQRAHHGHPSCVAAAAVLCALLCVAGFAGAPPATTPAPQNPPPPRQTAPASSAWDPFGKQRPLWTVKEERWYELTLGGKPCGFNCERVEVRPGDSCVSVATEMRLGRMGQAVVVRTFWWFEERSEGMRLEADIRKETGAAPVSTRWKFCETEFGKSVAVTDRQNGRSTEHNEPWPPGEWMPPNQAREFVRRRVAGGATQLDYMTVSPEGGLTPMRVQSHRTGTGTLTVNGRELSVTRWETRTSMLDKPSVDEFSADGVLVRSTTDVGVGVLEARLSTRERATAGQGSAEVMARTFVPLKQDGRGLHGANAAQLRVTAASGKLADLPTAGAQRVTRTSPSEAIVDVSLADAQPCARGDEADARYSRASVMVDSDDPRIKAFTAAALKGVPESPLKRVDALRAAVSRHMTRKDLKSGFATATEAMVSGAGDCTEHAVLLAACLRQAGIPARIASGLLYVEAIEGARNVYGWHMWTQALVGGKWVDADAVLAPQGPRSNAGHLLVATSAADGATLDTDLARIVELIGDVQVELVSVDGAPARNREGAP